MRCAAIALALVLAGCETTPGAPEVVYVTVEKIVPVPGELTQLCDLVEKQGNTYGEAIRLANARLESLKRCNADKAAIAELDANPAGQGH